MGKNKSYAKSFDVVQIPQSLIDKIGEGADDATQEEIEFINKVLLSTYVTYEDDFWKNCLIILSKDYDKISKFYRFIIGYDNYAADYAYLLVICYYTESNTISIDKYET